MPKNNYKIQKGRCELLKSGPLLSVRWEDKREMCLFITLHKGDMLDSNKLNYKTNEIIKKPECVQDYVITKEFY